jgi:hypothetical protein
MRPRRLASSPPPFLELLPQPASSTAYICDENARSILVADTSSPLPLPNPGA